VRIICLPVAAEGRFGADPLLDADPLFEAEPLFGTPLVCPLAFRPTLLPAGPGATAFGTSSDVPELPLLALQPADSPINMMAPTTNTTRRRIRIHSP
jgi:hypothetical protein